MSDLSKQDIAYLRTYLQFLNRRMRLVLAFIKKVSSSLTQDMASESDTLPDIMYTLRCEYHQSVKDLMKLMTFHRKAYDVDNSRLVLLIDNLDRAIRVMARVAIRLRHYIQAFDQIEA